MRLFITISFGDGPEPVERLCTAVRAAGLEDFCFVRDVENYQHVFDDPHDLMARALEEIRLSDALLIDMTDKPTGRAFEAGMAYALGKPIIVIMRRGTPIKDTTRGIAVAVIEYDDIEDVAAELKKVASTIAPKPLTPKIFCAVRAVIEDEQGRVVMLTEKDAYYSSAHTGLLDFPGGKIEPGETMAEAVRREVREECSLEVEVGEPFHVDEWRPVVHGQPLQIFGTFFRCRAVGGELRPGDDHATAQWVQPRDLKPTDLLPSNAEAVRKILDLRK